MPDNPFAASRLLSPGLAPDWSYAGLGPVVLSIQTPEMTGYSAGRGTIVAGPHHADADDRSQHDSILPQCSGRVKQVPIRTSHRPRGQIFRSRQDNSDLLRLFHPHLAGEARQVCEGQTLTSEWPVDWAKTQEVGRSCVFAIGFDKGLCLRWIGGRQPVWAHKRRPGVAFCRVGSLHVFAFCRFRMGSMAVLPLTGAFGST